MGAMSAVALIIPTVSIIFFFFGWEAVWLYFLTPLPIIHRNTANCSTWFNADIIFLCQDCNQNMWSFVPCRLSFETAPSGPDTAAHLHLIRSHKDDDLCSILCLISRHFLLDCFGQTRSLPFGILTSGQSLAVQMIWFGHNLLLENSFQGEDLQKTLLYGLCVHRKLLIFVLSLLFVCNMWLYDFISQSSSR